MTMLTLALSSLRSQPSRYATSFAALLCGAVLLMAFGSLLDTAGDDGVDEASSSVLLTMGLVVGGWSLLLVTFALTSMQTLHVRQRAAELTLLRMAGATRAQLTRMVLGETVVLALIAWAAALVPSIAAGRWIVSRLSESGLIASTTTAAFGGFAIHLGVGVIAVATVTAAVVATRRATASTVIAAATDASTESARVSRPVALVAVVMIFLGVDLAIVTATVMRGVEGFDPMATGGPAAIWFCLGLALLAPVLVPRVTARLVAPFAGAGVTGHLAALHLRRRTGQMAGAAMPAILFAGIALATLVMLAIDDAARVARGVAKTADYRNAETTNLLVIGMILAFAAIMIVNTVVATTLQRRRELDQLGQLGFTASQRRSLVAVEAGVVTAAGVGIGTVGSFATIVPFAIARETLVPAEAVLVWFGVFAVAEVVAVGAAVLACHRLVAHGAVSTGAH